MKLLIVGDYIAYDDFTSHIKANDCSLEIFGDFLQIIESNDFSIYNQEFPLTHSTSKYPTKIKGGCYKADPYSINLMKKAGFTHATLANNHIFDYGIEGLKETINNCEQNGIIHTGAGENKMQADELLIIEKNGIKLAIINITENEYSVANANHGGASSLDVIENAKRIKLAKESADFVFIISHGGIDFCKYPSPRLVKLFRFFIEVGADAVVSHHSHVTSGYEIYKNKPIFYDIGGFIPGRLIVSDCQYNISVQFEFINKKEFIYKIYPLKFDISKLRMHMLIGKDLSDFNKRTEEINRVLDNEFELKQKIKNHFLNYDKTSYYLNMLTRSNYFSYKVFRKLGLLKYYQKYLLLKNRKNRVNTSSWNMIRCETHRDVLEILFEEYYDNYTN